MDISKLQKAKLEYYRAMDEKKFRKSLASANGGL